MESGVGSDHNRVYDNDPERGAPAEYEKIIFKLKEILIFIQALDSSWFLAGTLSVLYHRWTIFIIITEIGRKG